MINSLKALFGLGPKTNYTQLIKNGALVIDVRTVAEFKGGHLSMAKNIPLDELNNKMKALPKEKVIITCCASGMRSASAKSILKNNGFSQVYNGGGWRSLENKLK